MVPKYEVRYSSEALDDIGEIYANILSVAWTLSADKWLRNFFEKTEKLAVFPEGNPAYRGDSGRRFLRVGKYIVIYSVKKEEKQVWVLRVIYGRREAWKVLERW